MNGIIRRRLPDGFPLTQILLPSTENPTGRLSRFRSSSWPGVRFVKVPVPSCVNQTWNAPEASATNAANRPSGEIAASSSAPSHSVTYVYFAVASLV